MLLATPNACLSVPVMYTPCCHDYHSFPNMGSGAINAKWSELDRQACLLTIYGNFVLFVLYHMAMPYPCGMACWHVSH